MRDSCRLRTCRSMRALTLLAYSPTPKCTPLTRRGRILIDANATLPGGSDDGLVGVRPTKVFADHLQGFVGDLGGFGMGGAVFDGAELHVGDLDSLSCHVRGKLAHLVAQSVKFAGRHQRHPSRVASGLRRSSEQATDCSLYRLAPVLRVADSDRGEDIGCAVDPHGRDVQHQGE
jgi:hypothetical protein